MEKVDVAKFQSLVGKKVFYYGWHYDNGGSAAGTIESIKEDIYRSGNLKVVLVEEVPKEDIQTGRMKDFSIGDYALEALLKGESYESGARLFSNSGVNIMLT